MAFSENSPPTTPVSFTFVSSPNSLSSPLSSVSSQATLCELRCVDEKKERKGPLESKRERASHDEPLSGSTDEAPVCLSDIEPVSPPVSFPLPNDEERACTKDLNDSDPPPDGGAEAWLCIASAFLLLFCVFGFVTSMGQLTEFYHSHQLQSYSKSNIAWIATLQSTLTFFASVFFGRIFDAYGARWLVRIGTTLSVASLVALAFCTQYYQFLLAHALFGFSGSFLWTPAASVSVHWFARHRSTAIGTVGCGSGVGGVVYPLLLERLLTSFSFRYAILIVAAMNAALMLPSWFLLKTRLPRRQPLPWKSLKKPWTEASYVCLVVGSGLCMLNMFSPYFDAPVLAASNNLPPNLSSYSIAILQAGSFFGRGTSGILADRLGVWRVFTVMGLLTATVLFAFWTAPINIPATVAGMALYGYTSGAWIMLLSAVTVAISPPHEAGTRVGLLWTIVSIPILIGPVVCGLLVSAYGGKFTLAGIFCGVSYMIGTAISAFPRYIDWARGTRARN